MGDADWSGWWVFLLWGCLGSLVADGTGYLKVAQAEGGIPPGYFTWFKAAATLVRATIGGVLATALGVSGQISVPFGALVVGISAPLLVDRYLQNPPKLPDITPTLPEKDDDADPNL